MIEIIKNMKVGSVIKCDVRSGKTLYLLKHVNGSLYPLENCGGSAKDQTNQFLNAIGFSNAKTV